MQPTLGRIVRYQETSDIVRAAIVTGVKEGEELIDLHIFMPEALRTIVERTSVAHDASQEPKHGTWHWPPRSDAPTLVKPEKEKEEVHHTKKEDKKK